MGDDWAAVAKAIRDRLTELGITQKQLVDRSGVSESTIRQLMNNYGPRRRGRHTLEDVSKGLNLPAGHLAGILDKGSTSRQSNSTESLRKEVADLRGQLADLAGRVEALEQGRHG